MTEADTELDNVCAVVIKCAKYEPIVDAVVIVCNDLTCFVRCPHGFQGLCGGLCPYGQIASSVR